MQKRREICLAANKKSSENAFERNRIRLMKEVGHKKVFVTKDVHILTSTPGVLVFLHKMVERGFLHNIKVRNGSYEAYIWEWANENNLDSVD